MEKEVVDTIKQIVSAEYDNNVMYGLSENGNLYRLEYQNMGDRVWKLVIGSPKIKLHIPNIPETVDEE